MDILQVIKVNCFGHHVRKAARAVTRAYDARMLSIDLKVTQFGLLVAFASHEDASLADIARKMAMEPSTLQRNLDVLRQRGFVRSDGARGRNGQRVTITNLGLQKLEEAIPIWHEAHTEIAERMSKSSTDVLSSLRDLESAATTMSAASS